MDESADSPWVWLARLTGVHGALLTWHPKSNVYMFIKYVITPTTSMLDAKNTAVIEVSRACI